MPKVIIVIFIIQDELLLLIIRFILIKKYKFFIILYVIPVYLFIFGSKIVHMKVTLKSKIEDQFNRPINSPKDCNLLAVHIALKTGRKISSSTLRRFFGLLPSKTSLSKYNLDTLSLYSSNIDYTAFCKQNGYGSTMRYTNEEKNYRNFKQITLFTLNCIEKYSLSSFKETLPREQINLKLNTFIHSELSIHPIISPVGYGKSTALAHWVNSINTHKFICLFCQATIFHELLNVEKSKSLTWHTAAGETKRIIESFTELQFEHDKKLIIVLDAFDGFDSNTHKIKEVIEYLITLLRNEKTRSKIKIVISCRETTWLNHIAGLLKNYVDAYFLVHKKQLIDSVYCNIPLLSNDEIRLILKRNSQIEPNRIIYNCLPSMLREMMRVPINVHLFISLFRKNPKIEAITLNRIYFELLKELIFKSKWAEEKEDIIWKVIDEIECNDIDYSMNKNELKNTYSIHLKRETNYYNAYKALILDGILQEERKESKFSIFTSLIRFKHHNFYFYLLTLKLIQKNKGLDFELFLSIAQSIKNPDKANFLVATLFEMAYFEEDYQTLEQFCELPESILSSIIVRHAVGSSFRINNSVRNSLIKHYAASPKGQIYFFEQFVDTNYMYNNYQYRIKEFLKHKTTDEALLFGNSILFLSGFLKMNEKLCKKQLSIINSITPNASIHPYTIGRRAANQILYAHFFEEKKNFDIYEIIENHRSIAYAYKGYIKNGLIELELPLIISLILTKEYTLLLELIEEAFNTYNLFDHEDEFLNMLSTNQNSIPFVFREFAKYKLNKPLTVNFMVELEKALNNYSSSFDDFQYQILLNWFLCDYFFTKKNITKANEYYQAAMEMAKYAEYDFYQAFLLINNPFKNHNLIEEGMALVNASGCCQAAF